MTLHPELSIDDTLTTDNPSETTQLESFPPLHIIRPDVLSSPTFKLEPAPPRNPSQATEDGPKRGHELAFALGLNLSIARFGSVVNTIITPWVEQKSGTEISEEKEQHYTTPLLSDVSDLTVCDTNNGMHLIVTPVDGDELDTLTPHAQSPPQPSIMQHLPGILRRKASFAESINSVRFTPGLPKSGTRPSLHITTDRSQERETLWSQWWSDLKFFPSTFWLICTLTVLLYGTVVPFNNVASDFLQSKWYHDNPRKAAAVMGIPDTIGAILIPGLGLIVDRYGKRASTLIVSAFIMVIVHSTLGFTMLNPIFAFSLLGIAYSMYGVALWPSIACVVTNELHLGKGYGISSSFLNISLTVVPPIVATIRVMGDSFIPVEMFFISMGLYGILVGFILKFIDRRDGGALEVPEIQVEVPVIVPQASSSAPNSVAPSPVMSHKRSNALKKRKRPALPAFDIHRLSLPDHDSARTRKRRSQDGDVDQDSLLQRREVHGDDEIASSPWDSIGSPLLQQYSSSPRYGSISTPSISTSLHDDYWDIEDGTKPTSDTGGYSVSQHPILYNPLRGSSGSFRINRSARPIAFGEGEEGRIYVDGQAVEPSHEGHEDYNSTSDSEQEWNT
ncbi:hypothetical protein BGZ80_005064 [Entomortierella chlamydospora]|uniref:Major facilitator superfamily (MFS) profile domain-containing protein n=1 Tax=Entomortierella chlamydospora TaxID=101097 RepID=A0A9P6ML63_9FUNG|nr:hypothetical protein BGZ80_005064 [Entomortierella chlamydospora]